jgi:alkanesulfonate monooxygenase SsuD/methylene tetrahydromethanopterin reductase-like flavin-dependent oxidoreductase (luciferase family)
MRIGIQLPEVERDVRWPEYRAMARAAEEVGFDSIWIGDHLLYDDPERGPWEAFTLLSALAAVTERLTLGPLVACAAFHPPGVLAKMAATVDEVSQGRFVLGLGSGSNRYDFDAFGLPYDKRVSRFEEQFAILCGLLAGERVTFEGTYHRVRDAVLLPKPARRVPLMLGSFGPRMLSIAAEHVDIWNAWYDDYGNTVEGFAELSARIPNHLERSACVLVQLDGPVERVPMAPPVTLDELPGHIRALGGAGADEVIVVASPINEESIRALGANLKGLAL